MLVDVLSVVVPSMNLKDKEFFSHRKGMSMKNGVPPLYVKIDSTSNIKLEERSEIYNQRL
jgi:hypothetical protein